MDYILYPTRKREPHRSGDGRLTPYLATTLLLMAALYCGLKAAPWMAENGWRPLATPGSNRLVEWRKASYDSTRDPVVGMELPVFRLNTEHGGKVLVGGAGTKQTALLFVGDTTPCSVRSLMASWSRLQEKNRNLKVVVVAAHPEPSLRGGCTKSKGNVQVVVDRDGSTARAFNADWKPRAYLIDRNGRLAYVQPETTMDPIAPLEAERFLAE